MSRVYAVDDDAKDGTASSPADPIAKKDEQSMSNPWKAARRASFADVTSRDFVKRDSRKFDKHLVENVQHDHALYGQSFSQVEHQTSLKAKHSKWIIGPKNKFRFCWDITQAVVLIYLSLDVPARVGLNEPSMGHTYRLSLFIDMFFYCDIVLNFFLAHEDEITGRVIWTMSGIRHQYMKGWFTIDLVASLPIDLVQRINAGRFSCSLNVPSDCPVDTQPDNSNGQVIRLVKLIRMFRLVKMLRLVRIQRLLNRYQDELFVYMGWINICKLITMLFFVGHLLGCFFFFFSTDEWRTEAEKEQETTGWIESNFQIKDILNNNGTVTGHTIAASMLEKYICAQYWAFTTMTTVGYGDISARTVAERTYAILGMVVGGLTFSVLVGSMGTVLNSDLSKLAQKERMNLVGAYVRDSKMPPKLRLRVLTFFRRQEVRAYEDRDFLSELPSKEREDVLLHCYGNLLRRLPLFGSIHKDKDVRAFVVDIMQYVNTKTITAGTIIISEGEDLKAMYLCKHGMVGVDGNDDGILDFKIEAPTFFGEESALGGVKSRFTFTCISQCDFLELEKREVIRALIRYPRVRQQLSALWEKRMAHFQTVTNAPASPDTNSNTNSNTHRRSLSPSDAAGALASPGSAPRQSYLNDEALQRVERLEVTVKKRFDAIDGQLRRLEQLLSSVSTKQMEVQS